MDGKEIAEKMLAPADVAPNERTIHKQVVRWAELQANAVPELKALFHPPNGGHRHKAIVGQMKAMGAKAGVPDLCLPIVRPGVGRDGKRRSFGALWLELKSKKGRLRDSQREWRDRLRRGGHAWALCRSFSGAKAAIMDYLDGSFDATLYSD